jgi:hypothetical protein
VDDDTEAGHPGGDVPGDPVQPGLVPLSYDLGNRHAVSFTGVIALKRPAVMRGQPACPRSEHPTPLPGAPSAPPGSRDCGIMRVIRARPHDARMYIIAALTEIAPGACA